MRFISRYFHAYWDGLLRKPLALLHQWFGLDTQTLWKTVAWKLFFTIVLVLLLFEVYLFIRTRYRKHKMAKAEETAPPMPDEAYVNKDPRFTESLEAAQAPEQTIEELKKKKEWARLGAVYASLGRHKEAANAFKRGKNPRQAAMELAKAGDTVRAARMLEKAGDPATAARFYAEKGKHAKAGRAYRADGNLPEAAAEFERAGKLREAADAFLQHFERSSASNAATEASAADLCLRLLRNPKAPKRLTDEQQRALRIHAATRFAAAKRGDLAASLFQEAGELERAGRAYLELGKLEEAAKCMNAAGNTRKAAEIGARHYAQNGEWKKAAQAYEAAQAFQQAGDAWSKAKTPARAAQCYVRAGEHFGAGFAWMHAGECERAIREFQHVPENHPRHDQAQSLLGRCFYELHDYEHCVAALENLLTGERVTHDNIEFFWMLALAYEQLGQLANSKAVLQKIRAIEVDFRDVSQRLSNIETRLSMGAGAAMPSGTPCPAERESDQATAVMQMADRSVGERYTLEKELGRGGMGVVYLARDTQLDRPVALKFLGALVDKSPEFRQRFEREAKAAARVNHPNIVSIYDIGTRVGEAYIAMEYVEGPNLHQYLQHKGQLAPREAINIMTQACSALSAVHEAGIIHRDIKPDNIVLTRGGLVKMMDFGLAKTEGARLTGTNVVMGTPAYMAPEQVNSEEATPATDVYAMGLVLHELLTGKAVFTEGDVLQRQVTEMPPRPSEVVEGIPDPLDGVVMRCVAKAARERFQSAVELGKALRQLAH